MIPNGSARNVMLKAWENLGSSGLSSIYQVSNDILFGPNLGVPGSSSGAIALPKVTLSGSGTVVPLAVSSSGALALSRVAVVSSGIQGSTGTAFPNSSTGVWTIAAPPATVGGWANLPSSPADGTTIGLTTIYGGLFAIIFSSAFGQWLLQYDGTTTKIRICGPDAGYVYFASTYTTTGGTFYWRRQGMRSLAKIPFVWTRSAVSIAATMTGFGGSLQYWGCWASALTETQILAQSHSQTSLLLAYSFIPLIGNIGTDTSGNSRNMTLTGTTTTSDVAPATAESAPTPTISTEIGRIPQDAIVVAPSVCSVSTSITVMAWVRFNSLPNDLNVNYCLSLYDDLSTEWLAYVFQYTFSISSLWTGFGGYHGGSNFTYASAVHTVAPADIYEWYCVAYTLTANGANTDIASYIARQGSSLAADATGSLPFLLGNTRNFGIGTNQIKSMYVQHVRMWPTALSLPTMQVAMMSNSPDLTAYAHIPLSDTQVSDVSGNSRTSYATGDLWSGITGPALTSGAVSSTGSISLARVTVVGAASRTNPAVSSTGNVSLQKVSVAGSAIATLNTTASGAIITNQVTIAAPGTITINGTASLGLSACTMAAVGTNNTIVKNSTVFTRCDAV